MRGINIKGYKSITKDKKLFLYDKPKYVYIGVSKNDKLRVIVGDNVYIGSVIATSDLNVYSSVSGRVVGFVDKTDTNGELIKAVKIENNFKDEYQNKVVVDEIDNYTKREFISILKECSIKGMGGAGFPTYLKYKTKTRIKHLIINAVECEPYITADYKIIKEKTKEILECIDAIMTINKIDDAYFVVKKNNNGIIKILNKIIGTYPKIKLTLVPDIYPMGWEKSIISYIFHKEYNELPIELDTVVNNVSTIYAIYEALKYHKPLIDRIVTFAGDGLKKSVDVFLKVGTDVSEVIEALGYKKDDLILVAGGPMMGTSVKEALITPLINAILLFKDNKLDIPDVCIRCGRCSSICPAKLSPILIKENIDSKELKNLHPEKCIECGLCSYICPAKILLKEHVIRAKGSDNV